jgi:hypothetical protein
LEDATIEIEPPMPASKKPVIAEIGFTELIKGLGPLLAKTTLVNTTSIVKHSIATINPVMNALCKRVFVHNDQL